MGCCHDPADFYIHRCDTSETQASRPGVHALIIGTSQYEYPHKGKTAYDGLVNIPGAAFGAAKFASFLSEEYHNPLGREILTVRLLLTPVEEEVPALEELGVTWQPASYERVRASVSEWYEDCDGSPENITILYAAGHGATDLNSFTRVFLKAEKDRPSPFYYSLNIKLIEEALEYNNSQSKIIISDCCHSFLDARHENGILIDVDDERKAQFARVPRKYDPLHITSARDGVETYALGANEGTVLTYVLEHLLRTAGRVVHSPVRYDERYFAITQDVMSEQVYPTFTSHPKAKYIPYCVPVIRGQTVDGGLHRPTPPPEFDVEFVVMDTARTDPVDVLITGPDGSAIEAEVSPSRKLELSLKAGEYTRKAPDWQTDFDIDKPERFDVLSRRSERL